MTKFVFALNARDEADVIEQWVVNVAPLASAVLMLDTGSEDDTIERFKKACDDHRLLGFVLMRPWVDFATNQTELLQVASSLFPDHYIWNLDADEEVVPGPGFDPGALDLDQDGYSVCRLYGGTYEVWGTRVFKAGAGWRYVGERHAMPDSRGKSVGRLTNVDVVNRRDGARGPKLGAQGNAERYSRDADLFSKKLQADPDDTRSAYYLAQSLKDAGRFYDAIQAYERRAAMPGGFAEERYLSLLGAAQLAFRVGYPDALVEQAFRKAIVDRPTRNEARIEFCRLLRSAGRWGECYELAFDAVTTDKPDDLFLVERGCYGWKPLFELALACVHLNDPQARQLCDTLLARSDLPAPEKRLVEQTVQRRYG